MADTTILTKLTIMMIVFLMAIKTGGRCALEDIIDMTLFASHRGMCAQQFKSRETVVESGRRPGRGGMAG